MRPAKYFRSLIAFFVITAGAIGATNWLVDPFLMTGAPRIDGFNARKPAIGSRVRQAKSFQYRRGTWDTVIVGNSRVEMGLNPDHACLRKQGWSTYNAAVPGAGVAEQLLLALNIIYAQDVQRVFVSVDYSDFLVAPSRAKRGGDLGAYAIARLPFRFDGTSNTDFASERVVEMAKALFSLDALAASVQTLFGQGGGSATRTVAGFNPADDFAAATRIEGAAAIFDQKLRSLAGRFDGGVVLTHHNGNTSFATDALLRFLKIAEAQGVEVYLHTNPFHDSYWELLATEGADTAYPAWLALMTRIAYRSDAVIGFWDFSASSAYTGEPYASRRRGQPPLDWFWESSHYRRELGDLMLSTMLADSCPPPVTIGRRVK